ncbi:MAG: ATP-binding cassette domain-containing protein [Clostridia bacterium]|nr:ATP-binding cassette domain-containing protein [Clostridia bacterium]
MKKETSAMLEVRNLTVRYPNHHAPAVAGLSFTVEEGGLLAVAGPSGCGKTTLLSALAGILPPASGELRFGGEVLDPKRLPIGFIPQSYGLLPWKTVRENILLFTPKDAEGGLVSLCARLGLGGLLDRWPRQLSGGQAQRVALARALVRKPRLLLMDEPFAALDAAASYAARELCYDLWTASGSTAIVVTHRLEEALYLAGRIAVMAPGGRFLFETRNPFQGVEEPSDPGYRALLLLLKSAVLDAAGEVDA